MLEPNSMSFEEAKERILNLKAQKPLVWDPVNQNFTFKRNAIIDLENIDLLFKRNVTKDIEDKPLARDAQKLLVWDPVNRKFTFKR